MQKHEEKAIKIADTYVGHFTDEQKAKKLGEELVELAYAIAKNDKENIIEELGDVGFLILHISSRQQCHRTITEYVSEYIKSTVNEQQFPISQTMEILGKYLIRLSMALAEKHEEDTQKAIAGFYYWLSYICYWLNDLSSLIDHITVASIKMNTRQGTKACKVNQQLG